MLARAQKTLSELRVALADAASLPFAAAAFDLVTANFVISHVRDYRAALREAIRVLVPGGRLAISNWVPPMDPYDAAWRELIGNAVDADAARRALQEIAPWESFFSDASRMRAALEGAGFAPARVEVAEIRLSLTVRRRVPRGPTIGLGRTAGPLHARGGRMEPVHLPGRPGDAAPLRRSRRVHARRGLGRGYRTVSGTLGRTWRRATPGARRRRGDVLREASREVSIPPVGTIQQIWRFPVKSMGGERLQVCEVHARGLRGDRVWALRDERKGAITGGKKIPTLMLCSARLLEEPRAEVDASSVPPVAITFPDSTEVVSDDPRIHERLSAFVGREVTLQPLQPADDKQHYRAEKPTLAAFRHEFGLEPGEPLPDFSEMPISMLLELSKFATPRGTYFDCYGIHLLTTASLEALRQASPQSSVDVRRFRPNFLVDTGEATGLVEFGWCGSAMRIGSAGFAMRLEIPTVRCSMPTRAQRDLGADPSVLKTIASQAKRCLGVYGSVESAGAVRVGDRVELESPKVSVLSRWAHARAAGLKRLLLKATLATMRKE